MKDLVVTTIQANSKAIAGGISGAFISYLTTRGFEIPKEVSDAVIVLAAFIIGYAVTWLSPKNK